MFRVNNLNIFGGKKANHVLLNEYTSGKQKITFIKSNKKIGNQLFYFLKYI